MRQQRYQFGILPFIQKRKARHVGEPQFAHHLIDLFSRIFAFLPSLTRQGTRVLTAVEKHRRKLETQLFASEESHVFAQQSNSQHRNVVVENSSEAFKRSFVLIRIDTVSAQLCKASS